MSRERAQRREAREAEAEAETVRRAAVAAREAQAARRRRLLLGWLPRWWSSERRGPVGILAERRRQQLAATLALIVGVNLLAFAFSPDWSLRALVLVASLLGAPVAHVMLSRRT